MKAILIVSLIFLCLISSAQQDMKIYAFKHVSLPALPNEKKNETNEGTKKAVVGNYLLYLTYTNRKEIELVELWLNDEVFGVNEFPIDSTPIHYTYDENSFQPQRLLLVPPIKGEVLQLKPVEKILSKISLPKRPLAKTNELVLVYKDKDKLSWMIMKKVKSLPPKLRQ